jgi:hypothetical protein
VAMSIWVKWLLMIVGSGMLGASIPMLWTGHLPPPMTNVKIHPILSTSIFVIGLTLLLVFGTPDLLQQTIELL